MPAVAATPAAPLINAIQCTTGGNLPVFSVMWTPQQGFSGPFTVLVTDSVGNAIAGTSSSVSSTGATWTATSSMTAASDFYYLQVAVTGNLGIVSDRAPLLFAPVTAITTAYDGTTLSVGWTGAASMLPAGQTQLLLMTPLGVQSVLSAGSGYAQILVDPQLRNSGGNWSVYLTPQTGAQGLTSSGPDSSAAIYNIAPTVTQVTVEASPAGVSLILGVPAAINTPYFVVSLQAAGRTLSSSAPLPGVAAAGTGLSVTYAFPGIATLGACQVVAALSSATAGVSLGPASQPFELILAAPTDVHFSVDANGADRLLTATVTPPSGPWAASSLSLMINNPDGSPSAWHTKGFGFTQQVSLQAPTVGGAYTLLAQVNNGPSFSPRSRALPIITGLPTLSSATVDQRNATLAWTAVTDTGVSAYQVQVLNETGVIATHQVTATTANLPLPDLATSISVRALGENSRGPSSAALPVINQAPDGLASAWPATNTGCALSWTRVTGAVEGYTVEVLRNDQSITQLLTASASLQVPAAVFAQAGRYSFRVRASRTSAPALLGPWSASVPIISAAPAQVRVDYDGGQLTASWSSIETAQGYRLVLLENGAESGAPWFCYSTDSAAALAYDATKAYSLAVQAFAGTSVGPATRVEVLGHGLYPQFLTGTAPNLVPVGTSGLVPAVIAIGLPQLFTSAPAELPVTAPFSLLAGAAPYSYVLNIAGAGGALPWTFTGDAIRVDLYTAYQAFLAQLETLGATPFGVQTVQAAIARAMPQTFAETLLYGYGFDARSGCVDLMAGMVLRVEYESYQSLGGAVPDQAYLNGFVTSAVAQYAITRSANAATGVTALDAFIGWLVGQGGTQVTTPPVSNRKQAGGGGLIDSGYPLMQQPFLRLVYPTSFPSTNQTGTPYPEFNALLLAAPTLAALNAATHNLRAGNAAGDTVGVLYLRGRTTLVPQIRVWVNGVEQLMSLGSCLGDLLAERAMQPSAVNVPLQGVRLRRGIGPAVSGSPASYDASAATPVRLDWVPSANAALTGLPLLGGDSIELAGSTAR